MVSEFNLPLKKLIYFRDPMWDMNNGNPNKSPNPRMITKARFTIENVDMV